MPSDKATRAYQQTTRAEQSEANTRRVIGSAVGLLRTTRRIDEVTLDAVAAQSGVTVRTILRHFGTRDGLLEAAFLALGDEFSSHRISPQPDNIDAAIQSLLENYEQDGDVNIRALEQEHDFPLVHEALQRGRAYHRVWLEQLFAPHLAPLKPGLAASLTG